jgi:hypothetical protein
MVSPPAPMAALPAEQPPSLNLAELPAEALARILGISALSLPDLGRAACVSQRLRGAACDAALPQWRGVRVIGGTCQWPWLKPDIFEVRARPARAACAPRAR